MAAFETVAVPFTMIGNRRAITDRVIAENPWLTEFLQIFDGYVERDESRCCWFLYPN